MSDICTSARRGRFGWNKIAMGGTLAMAVAVPQPVLAGNAVTRWVEHALQAVRDQNVGTPNAGRLYAMTTVAAYDAVNGIDRARHLGREHAMVPPAGAPWFGDRRAAAAAAAHAVLVALVPAQAPLLDAALAEDLDDLGAQFPWVVAGRQWGRHVGEQVVALRANDGTQTAVPIPAGTGIGEHRANFDARFANMTAFGIDSIAPYQSGPPPALDSPEYAAAYDDVKAFGQPDGDPERDEISLFWLAEGGTVRETGTWFQAALSIVEERGTDRSLSATARLFAQLGMAVADAVTLSWDTKARFFTWRPFFAIHEGDLDGNPATVADPGWVTRLGPTGGSPEYNSGTSAFAGAASAVLERFYCDDALAFCFETDLAPAGPRCYSSALEGAVEAGRSRIYQGIHFQFSNEDGRRAGRGIGAEVARDTLRRLDGRRNCRLP